jgi:hypothetical protein
MVYVAVVLSCTRLHLDDMAVVVGIFDSHLVARLSLRIGQWVIGACHLMHEPWGEIDEVVPSTGWIVYYPDTSMIHCSHRRFKGVI